MQRIYSWKTHGVLFIQSDLICCLTAGLSHLNLKTVPEHVIQIWHKTASKYVQGLCLFSQLIQLGGECKYSYVCEVRFRAAVG